MIPARFALLFTTLLTTVYALDGDSFKQGRVRWTRSASGQNYPTEWQLAPASSNKPEWIQALNDAIAAGKIPNIPPSKLVNGQPTYPAGTPDPCNWSNTQCQGKGDIYYAPNGYMGIQFDDGPTPASPQLREFLTQNDIAATHFMIGSNILDYSSEFDAIFKVPNQHIAVHTWSHNMSTTLPNEVMLAELGWTMQIIYDRSGKIPAWWRAPMGDLDNRIRAIAYEVFGLTAVNWNYDSNDWCMEADGSSDCAGENPGKDQTSITNYIDQTVSTAPKSPGVIMLEHELTTYSVNAFIQHTWPGISKYGWKFNSIPELFGLPWYANSYNNTTPNSSQTSFVKSAIVPGGNSNGIAPSSSTAASAASTTTITTSASGTIFTTHVVSTPTSTAQKGHDNAAPATLARAFSSSSLLLFIGALAAAAAM